MVISHNLLAMNTNRQFNITNKAKTKSAEKLASGYHINRAADDAAGLSISEKMRRQIRGLTQGVENTQDGVSLCQVADGALAEVQDMLHRITELSVQSANGTNSEQDRQAIQEEINQILKEIDRIGDTTSFNERKIFKGSDATANNTGNVGGVTQPGATIITKDRTLDVSVKGTPTDSVAKTYSVISDEFTGMQIDTTTYKWEDIQNADGKSLADAKIEAGTYSVTHNGMTMEIKVSEGQTLDNIASKINGVTWSTTETVVSKEMAVDNLSITPHKKLGSYTSTNYPSRNYIYADDEGLKVDNGTIRTWEEMGIDFDNLVTGTYTFTDPSSEVEFTFDILEDATKDAVIAGLNEVQILSSTLYEADMIAYADITTGNARLSPMQSMSGYGNQITVSFSKTDGEYLNVLNKSGYQEYFEFAVEDGEFGLKYIGGSSSGPFDLSTSKDLFFEITNESKVSLQNFDYTNVTDVADWVSNPIVFKHGDSEIRFYLYNTGTGSITSYDELVAEYTKVSDSDSSGALLSFGSHTYGQSAVVINQYAEDTYGVYNQAHGNIGKVTYDVSLTDTILVDDTDTYEEIITNPTPIPPSPPTTEEIRSLTLWIQSGAEAGNGMWLEIDRMNTKYLGISDTDVSTEAGANNALTAVEEALKKVSYNRSKIGAQQNRLEHTIANEENVIENTTAAESRIRDTNMAKEMVQYSMLNILSQAGQSMMSQANQSTQGVLTLLQ